jgi:hypothetical protein
MASLLSPAFSGSQRGEAPLHWVTLLAVRGEEDRGERSPFPAEHANQLDGNRQVR